MDPTPRDLQWCVIACSTKHRVYTMRLPESLIEFAIRKGWRVLIRDSEMPQGPHVPVEPSQSGPQRDYGDERPPDYGEQ